MDGLHARGEGGEEGESEGWMVEGGDQIVPDDSGLSVISEEEAASIFSHSTSNRLQPDRYLGKNVWNHLYQVTFEFRTPL